MKFKIPFTISDVEISKRRSKSFLKFVKRRNKNLERYLQEAKVKIDSRNYMAICYRSFLLAFLILSVVFTSVLGLFRIENFAVFGILGGFLFSGLVLFNQVNYPRIYSLNKMRSVESNLLPALQDMMVQLNSGVPIFMIMMNIADADYGELSKEFKKIVNEINSGVSQIEAIEQHAKLNSSKYFRRILWQISNGMRAGTDMSAVIRDSIDNLGDEQAIQVQSYGSKLNPLIMFYMLIAIILPSLGVTFLIIISSLLSLSEFLLQIIFAIIFVFVVFMQIMFLGMIKSRRPSLL